MRKLGAVLVLAAALAMAGCANGPIDRPVVTPPASQAEAPVTAAPITAAPEPADETSRVASDEKSYLEAIKAFWKGELPADTDLLGAGQAACDALSAGTSASDVVAVVGDGEDATSNNGRVVTSATQYLCPEFF